MTLRNQPYSRLVRRVTRRCRFGWRVRPSVPARRSRRGSPGRSMRGRTRSLGTSHQPRPQLRALVGVRGPREHPAPLALELDLHLGVGLQVAIPLRIRGKSALRGHDDDPLAVGHEQQRCDARQAALLARRGQQADRHAASAHGRQPGSERRRERQGSAEDARARLGRDDAGQVRGPIRRPGRRRRASRRRSPGFRCVPNVSRSRDRGS
jgi:hypothetical protein